jgi:hypothetical protein
VNRTQHRAAELASNSRQLPLGGISRINFQMNAASLPHVKIMRAIDAIGTRVVPALRERLADD